MSVRLLAASAIGLALAFTAGCSVENSAGKLAAADNFLLVDNAGVAHELYRLKDAKAVVLVAQVNGDETSRAAAAKAAEMKAAFPGVEFFLLNSSLSDDRAAIVAEAQAQGFTLPVLDDDLQFVGEHLGFTTAGEAMVIDPKTWKVVYRGPVDAAAAAKPAKGYLEAALTQMSAGEAVAVASVATAGPAISFPERERAAEFANISYETEVAPILEAKCVACHQEGGIGPFAMSSYEVVKGFAPMMREAIRTDRMPPWHADPTVGSFHDDKSLTPEEARTLVHWIEAGAPRGEGADPLALVRHVAPEWPLGEPDVVIDIPEYTIPASGVVDYQRPYALYPLKEGRWLRASTVKAGERQGVHHILTGYIENPPPGGTAPESMWGSSVGGYAVGAESSVMPEKVGTWVPAGGAIGFQMHYTPFGKEAVDQSKIALYFYPEGEKPEMIMRGSVVIDTTIKLPANTEAHKEIAYNYFPNDALLYSAFPHAHYRGQASKLELIKPDGTRELLVNLPRYDFNWQRAYEFDTPVLVPAGSKLVATYLYDNSARNPANPDPSKEITWGDQSFEEMLFTSLRYRWTDETVETPVDHAARTNKYRMHGMMDDNLNDKIEVAELRGRMGEMLKANFERVDSNADGGIDVPELERAMQFMQGMNQRRRGSGGSASGQP